MYYTKFNTRLCEIILAGDKRGLAHLHLNTGEGTRRFAVLPEWELSREFFVQTKSQILEYIEGKRQHFNVTINPYGTKFQKKSGKNYAGFLMAGSGLMPASPGTLEIIKLQELSELPTAKILSLLLFPVTGWWEQTGV